MSRERSIANYVMRRSVSGDASYVDTSAPACSSASSEEHLVRYLKALGTLCIQGVNALVCGVNAAQPTLSDLRQASRRLCERNHVRSQPGRCVPIFVVRSDAVDELPKNVVRLIKRAFTAFTRSHLKDGRTINES